MPLSRPERTWQRLKERQSFPKQTVVVIKARALSDSAWRFVPCVSSERRVATVPFSEQQHETVQHGTRTAQFMKTMRRAEDEDEEEREKRGEENGG